jgi:hypothetical protein
MRCNLKMLMVSLFCQQMLEDAGFENVQAEDQTTKVTCLQLFTEVKIVESKV